MTTSVSNTFSHYKSNEDDDPTLEELGFSIEDGEYFSLNVSGKRVMTGELSDILLLMNRFIQIAEMELQEVE